MIATHRQLALTLAASAGLLACGASSARDAEPPREAAVDADTSLRYDPGTRDCCAGRVYRARGTGYYPHDDRMQGGYFDRRGKKLSTLQDFLEGKAKYAALAMDKQALPYGTLVCIPGLNEKHGKSIQFRVVDTGGAFKGKGLTRMDVCTRGKSDTLDPAINREFEFVVCEEQPYRR